MNFSSSQLQILELIKNTPFISRKDISSKLGLTSAAITKNLKILIDEKIVLEASQRESTGGRKSANLILNKNWFGKILGLSLTPSSLCISIGNILGDISFKAEILIEKDNFSISFLYEHIEKFLKKFKDIKVISLILTGLVNSDTGELIFSPHYNLKKINLKKEIETRFNIPTIVENDVKAMAISEFLFGVKSDNFVVLNVSEGIGSSIFSNGSLLNGYGFISGEIGHVIMDRTSLRKCSCGKRGCLEAEASNSAIINKLTSMIKLNNYSLLKETLYKNGKITITDIISAIDKKDFLTIKVASEAIVFIAHSIDMIISILNPQKIILMGDIFKSDFLLRNLKIEVQKVTLEEQKYDLIVSSLKEEIHYYNPISVAIYNMFKKILK